MKMCCLAVLSLLLVLGSYAKAADRPSISTDWHVYVDGQTEYASEHVAKRTLESGDLEYTSAEFGFRVSSPNKDCQMIPTLKAGTLEMRFSVSGDDRVLVHCAATSLPVPFEAEALMAHLKR